MRQRKPRRSVYLNSAERNLFVVSVRTLQWAAGGIKTEGGMFRECSGSFGMFFWFQNVPAGLRTLQWQAGGMHKNRRGNVPRMFHGCKRTLHGGFRIPWVFRATSPPWFKWRIATTSVPRHPPSPPSPPPATAAAAAAAAAAATTATAAAPVPVWARHRHNQGWVVIYATKKKRTIDLQQKKIERYEEN